MVVGGSGGGEQSRQVGRREGLAVDMAAWAAGWGVCVCVTMYVDD